MSGAAGAGSGGKRRRRTALAALAAAALGWAAFAWRSDGAAPPVAPEPAASLGAAVARAAPAAPLAPADAELQADVEAIVARWKERASAASAGRARPAEVRVGVHVREVGRRADSARLGADVPMRPASNMKLVTTAAALVLLGPGGVLETRFEASGPIADGRLAGDLVVRAGGDPFYDPSGLGRVEGRLAEAARALSDRGLQAIAGDLVLDPRTFPDPAPGPAWPDPSQHWQDYCALAGGFTLNGGILAARVVPRAPGAAAAIDVRPSPHGLAERYGVATVAGGTNDLRVGATASAVTVRGALGADLGERVATFAHPDPALLFESVLVDALERAGIALEGAVRRERGRPPGEPLVVLRSPIAELLAPINAESVNSVADQLFLATGLAVSGRADREAGALATARALERLGVPAEGLRQLDGSGLSFDDRVTPRQVTALLVAAARDPEIGEAFLSSLALAGETGTLEGRMRDGPARGRVWAKTGWIRGTSALSGLARRVDGEACAFSILVSYPPEIGGLNNRCFKPMQDEIVERVVLGPARAASERGSSGS